MNHLKQNRTLFALIFVCLFTSTSITSRDNETIVTVNGQEIMTKSKTGQKMQKQLKDSQDELTKPLQPEQEKIQKLEKDLLSKKEKLDEEIANSKTLSTDVRNKKLEELQDDAATLDSMKRDFDRLVQKFQNEMRKVESKFQEHYQKLMTKFDTLVRETIKDLAQRENWTIVLMEESVVYATKAISKTEMIIEELDKRAQAADQAKKAAIEKKNNQLKNKHEHYF